MPAAVSDRPPRKGPISRYFMPLKAFSSGFEDSAPSLSLSVEAAGCAVWVVSPGFAAFAAFDCRSGLTWAITVEANKIAKLTSKTKRATKDGCLRKVSGAMFKSSPEEVDNYAMV